MKTNRTGNLSFYILSIYIRVTFCQMPVYKINFYLWSPYVEKLFKKDFLIYWKFQRKKLILLFPGINSVIPLYSTIFYHFIPIKPACSLFNPKNKYSTFELLATSCPVFLYRWLVEAACCICARVPPYLSLSIG